MTKPPSGSSGSSSGPGTPVATPAPLGFIGRYQTLEKIGEGGMGSLFLARDPAIDRLVAIKLLRRGFDTAPLRERFAREARAAGRLRHPNIVTIFDVGEHDGDPFIAMEFLAGETLAELIRHGARMSLSRRLKLIEELCDGLAYAHRAGLVHRDVKPANLMVDADGILKILDFGIVRLGNSGMTQAGMLVGTVNYMSPEQVLGTPVDHRSDIFAVGLVAYELISGRQAFPGTMKDGLLNKITNVAFEPVLAVVPGLDAEVTAIVDTALKKEPADRYQDLARMRNELARARVRIERAEEQAAIDSAADSGETALISQEVTMAGPDTPGPRAASAELAADAERALADGNYRAALTIAGRSAAINPQDRSASGVAARAEAALLDRGRLLESGSGIGPRASSSASVAAPTPSTPSQPATQTVSGRSTQLAVAVAVLALIIAAVAVWPQLRSSRQAQSTDAQTAVPPHPLPAPPAATDTKPTPAESISVPPPVVTPPPSVQPDTAAADPKPEVTEPSKDERRTVDAPAATDRRAGRSATTAADSRRPSARGTAAVADPPPVKPAEPAPSQPAEAPPATLRAGVETSVPQRTHYVPPAYPADARAAGIEGTVNVELTINTDGRVSDAHVVRSIPALDAAALAAVRQWEFKPPRNGNTPVKLLYTVQVPFDLPEPPKPLSAPPGVGVPPPSAPPVSKPAETAKPPTPAPSPAPPQDPRADDAAIRDVLRRYQAAWQALDLAALQRVQALSSDQVERVRATMAGARSYVVDVNVESITIDPSGRTASAQCVIRRHFQPRSGLSREVPARAETIRFEKRGEAWTITDLQQ
jgi:TonB family protein